MLSVARVREIVVVFRVVTPLLFGCWAYSRIFKNQMARRALIKQKGADRGALWGVEAPGNVFCLSVEYRYIAALAERADYMMRVVIFFQSFRGRRIPCREDG